MKLKIVLATLALVSAGIVGGWKLYKHRDYLKDISDLPYPPA